MRSCLYECRVMHQRFFPKAHRFDYRLFLFAIDLDELPQLSRVLRWLGVNRRAIYSFRERDFFPSDEPAHAPSANFRRSSPRVEPSALKGRIVAHLGDHGIDLAGGRVVLVTLPRVFGYAFNPVSFYFCFDHTDRPVAAFAEVTNTFREVKLFRLGPDCLSSSGEFRLRVPKHFYVSPYSDIDVAFDFRLRVPGEKLSVQIDDYADDRRSLTSTLAGPRREISDTRLAWFTLKYPLITIQVIARIHWQALRLWLKRVPWFRKSARADEQRDLHRPHFSIASPSSEP